LLHLDPPPKRAETSLEPREGTAGEFFKAPVVGISLLLRFFSNGVG